MFTQNRFKMDEFLVPLETPCVYHDPDFIDPSQADAFYQELLKNIPWEKTAKINRWVHICQEPPPPNCDEKEEEHQPQQRNYAYKDAPSASSTTYVNPPFPEAVQTIRKACQDWYQKHHGGAGDTPAPSFNVCLLNFYQDGTQRIGWHADREEIGRTTPIASVSLGTTRQFLIRSQANFHDRCTLQLKNGSMVVMEPICQVKYLHSIAKEPEIQDGRINLTFRCKDWGETTAGEEMHEQRDQFLDKLTDGAAPQTAAWTVDGAKVDIYGSSAATHVFGESLPANHGEMRDNLTPKQVYFLAKTNLGAEKYCAAEIQEKIDTIYHEANGGMRKKNSWAVIVRPFDLDGFVACCMINHAENGGTSGDSIEPVLAEMQSLLITLKSAHHVMRYHYHFRLNQCREGREVGEDESTDEMSTPKEALYEHVKAQLLNGNIALPGTDMLSCDNEQGKKPETTFRVTCERIGGPHPWQAPDVEYECGGAISQVMEQHGWKVKMNDYDICIRADVIGKYVVLSTQLNIHDMAKGRHTLKYRNAVTIKTNVAYAMLRLANLLEGNTLLDPFCGSGTILLEALLMFQGKLSVVGMDVSKKSADGARENADADGYAESYGGKYLRKFVTSDARGLKRHVNEESVDAVVTNLPWGIQTGQHQSVKDLQTLYEVFLRNCWYILKPEGRIVLFVLRGLQMMRIVRKLSGRFRLLHVNVIRTSNNLPSIMVIEKLQHDEVRESIKSQLAHLNQFVNVSPEIFQSIHTEELEDD
jgi:tRNA G10  N-methylase Trm11/alkylated DNA repair dioxygenase AlkB